MLGEKESVKTPRCLKLEIQLTPVKPAKHLTHRVATGNFTLG